MDVYKILHNRKNELEDQLRALYTKTTEISTELENIKQVTNYLDNNVLPIVLNEVFVKYMTHIEAYCNWAKLSNGENPDESFMRGVEEKIGISENAKKAFREEMLIKNSAYHRKGKEFNVYSHDRLREAIERYCIAR